MNRFKVWPMYFLPRHKVENDCIEFAASIAIP